MESIGSKPAITTDSIIIRGDVGQKYTADLRKCQIVDEVVMSIDARKKPRNSAFKRTP